MSVRRHFLAATAALALVAVSAPTASAGLLEGLGGLGGLGSLFGNLKGSGGIIRVLEAIYSAIFPVETPLPQPPTVDGAVLAGTQQPIGRSGDSYITGDVPSANPLFPAGGNLEWLPPDGETAYTDLRLQDRGARVDEAEAHATAVTTDDLASPARLDGFVATNGLATDLLTVGKTGTTVAIETAGQLHKLTSLQAEANQIAADQHMQEDWARKQANVYAHVWNAEGYWAGPRTFRADAIGGAGY